MVAWLARDSLGATEEDPHSRAVTCRLLGQQRIALPSQELITLRLQYCEWVRVPPTDTGAASSDALIRLSAGLPRLGRQRSASRESSVGLYEGAVYELRKHCYGQVSDHRTRNFNGR